LKLNEHCITAKFKLVLKSPQRLVTRLIPIFMRRRFSRFTPDLAEKNKNEPSLWGRP